MEKSSFQKAYEKLEVPHEDVLKSIQKGMNRADSDAFKTKRKNRTIVYHWRKIATKAKRYTRAGKTAAGLA